MMKPIDRIRTILIITYQWTTTSSWQRNWREASRRLMDRNEARQKRQEMVRTERRTDDFEVAGRIRTTTANT